MSQAPFFDLAKALIGKRLDMGQFQGYSDHELDGKTDELAADLEQVWIDACEDMRRNEPTPEDRKAENAEAMRDLAA